MDEFLGILQYKYCDSEVGRDHGWHCAISLAWLVWLSYEDANFQANVQLPRLERELLVLEPSTAAVYCHDMRLEECAREEGTSASSIKMLPRQCELSIELLYHGRASSLVTFTVSFACELLVEQRARSCEVIIVVVNRDCRTRQHVELSSC